MAVTVGAMVAVGSRSTVHEWGHDAVIKVPRTDACAVWLRYEAAYSTAVRQAGAPVPEFLGFVDHEGRTASVYRRARGVVMWDAIVGQPGSATVHGRRLAELQASLRSLVPPITLPSITDRARCKVRAAAPTVGLDPDVVLAELPPTARTVVCHGDLHPGNVVLTADGPALVDWFDAGRGDPLADIARSTLLMSPAPAGTGEVAHLPGGDRELRVHVRDAYLDAARGLLDVAGDAFERWCAVLAVARIAEGVGSAGLLDVWRRWERRRRRSALVAVG